MFDQSGLDDRIRKTLTGIRQSALLNYGEINAIKVVHGSLLDHTEIRPEYLQAVQRIFAPPAEFPSLLGRLREPGSVLVLNQGPERGRTITAHATLAALLHEQLIVEAHTIPFGGSTEFRLDRLPAKERLGFVLELPEDDPETSLRVSEGFGSKIAALSEALRRRDCRLIVLTRPQQWHRVGRLGVDDRALGHSFTNAPPHAIAERWLAASGLGSRAGRWVEEPQIAARLKRSAPLDVLEIVDRIVSVHTAALAQVATAPRRADGAPAEAMDDFPDQVAAVVAACDDWREDLLAWHVEKGRSSFERDFLIAASVLRNAPIGHIYERAVALGHQLDSQCDTRAAGQAAPGIIELVASIKAKVTKEETIAFDRPAWDDAALEYFWLDRPLARIPFCEWLARVPGAEAREAMENISAAERQRLAERITSFALRWAVRHQRPVPLEKLATAWYAVREQRGQQYFPILIDAIDAASVDSPSSKYLHSTLLKWSRQEAPALRAVVAAVCAREFGRAHTGKALVRLGHVGRSQDASVADALRDAVRSLWADPSVRTTLFNEVVGWCAVTEGSTLPGQRAFLVIAQAPSDGGDEAPALLTGQDGDFAPKLEDMATCWGVLLDSAPERGPAGEVEQTMRSWFETAARYQQLAPIVLNTFQLAARGPDGASSSKRRDLLRKHASTWRDEAAPDPDAREKVYNGLTRRLDRNLTHPGERVGVGSEA
ncbi:hypothetical protein ACFFWA_26895 [Actinomadura verrucosospora]|uniref:hypothetical protein n=1 Tax=Actinomadura verrucosospora TaxID=46165 RepID=UPI0031E885DE